MSSRQGRLWSCSLLPISSVILRVRQDIKNEDSLRLVVHPCDQTILVARDVEYCSSSNQISFAVHLFHFRRRFQFALRTTAYQDSRLAFASGCRSQKIGRAHV